MWEKVFRKKDGVWKYDEVKDARVIKKRCACEKKTNVAAMKCALIIDSQRQDLFKNFWLMDWKQKKIYVNTLVHSTKPSRPQKLTNDSASTRTRTLKYHFKVDKESVRVCRTFLLNTLSIGRRAILNWVSQTQKVEKKCTEQKKYLNLFFDALPTMESHYCRAVTAKKYLLPDWRSKKMLYDSYCEHWCTTHNVRPLSIANFHSEFDIRNLGLFTPKKDQCDICARHSVGSLSLENYALHQKKKEEARSEKRNDICEESHVFTVDLQTVLMAPKSQISSSYYRTKLQVQNLVFFNVINEKGYCFLWNEAEGGLNAEEFASIWLYFIEKKIVPTLGDNDSHVKIIFYTDGCTYQNRNSVMSNALLNAAVKQNIA